MGMTVFSGMLFATVIGVCLVPVLFVAIEKLVEAKGGAAQAPGPKPDLAPRTTDGH
jgi:HAE1 family hydrophobic/amphiphilic exporter-1